MNNILKPWYAVATPHEDIREGRLAESVFAANLWAVVQGTAPEVYLDAEEFYHKTYLTTGLSQLLNRVSSALRSGGEVGDRIISLQTAFGGGKTHTLVALWHLAKNVNRLKNSSYAECLEKAVEGQLVTKINGVAVFTNQTCDPTQGRKVADGIHLRTLWGELAYQLGGKSLYEHVRANDENQRVPQGIFVEILQAASPCLILLDELADYCVGASAVSIGQTNLADQTISFIQQLTESVQQVPGAVVVATLPASRYEIALSEKGQEAFMALEKRFQRLGSDVKPVADNEIYEVVRARLFESITQENDPDYPKQVARVYQDMYAKHSGEIPSEAAKSTYREQIQRAYPFHPTLIDALYTRWGSNPDLQRTRGVLRLLAGIVGDLWKRRNGNTQTQHLIQPCHVRWSVDAVQAALTRLWGPTYQSVAVADVIGERSNAGVFDEERGGDYQNEAIAEGLASAILLGSFGGQGGRSGFSAKDLKLVCSRWGLNWSYTAGALLELESRCFYLHTVAAGGHGKRYWFGTRPTLNKLVVQYRQQIAKEDFNEKIIENIRNESRKNSLAGSTWRVIVAPTKDLPEQRSLALLILSPSLAWDEKKHANDVIQQYIESISTQCGQQIRIYRNTLIYLVATKHGLSRLRQAHRNWAALEGVRTDYWDQLDDDQRDDLKERLNASHQSIFQALGSAYTVALRVRESGIEAISLSDTRQIFQEHLGYLWTTLVEEEEWILRRVGSVTLENTGLIPKEGSLRLKDAIQAYLRYTDKPMIATKEAVTIGLVQACTDGLIGIGRGGSPSSLQVRYCKEVTSLDSSEDGLWIIPPFETEVEKIHAVEEGKTESSSSDIDEQVTPEKQTTAEGSVEKIVVQGGVSIEQWADLFRCFINPAARMKLEKLGISIQFKMIPPKGEILSENDSRLRSMKESADQLGLKIEIEKQ